MFYSYLQTSGSFVIYLFITLVLGYFLGKYIYNYIYLDKKIKYVSFALDSITNGILKLAGTHSSVLMKPKKYLLHLVVFSFLGFIFLFILLLIQGFLFLNPNHVQNMRWDTALNTAFSFVTNTNWQSYKGETDLSYLSQTLGLTTQNFFSAAIGICVLFVLIRAFTNKENQLVGNFYVDLIKTIIYLLLPLSIIGAIILVANGVPQTYNSNISVNQLLTNQNQTIYLGPVASQVIIKQLGSNGGGFYGANSAYPFENPTAFSNMVESISMLLIPVSLCFTFGFAVKDKKQGTMMLKAMTFLFVVTLILYSAAEFGYKSNIGGTNYIGNLNGKEARFGIGDSSFWSVSTTSTSNGSTNSNLADGTPLGSLVLIFLMQLGEIVYGGVGSGLYGMIAFVLLTIFISGLMIGKTPEYLSKKIDSFDMKMVCLIVLPAPALSVMGTAITTLAPSLYSGTTNNAYGFTSILYAFTSMANNNGSAMSSFNSNTIYVNIFGGIIMAICRFVPMIAVMFMAKSLSSKKLNVHGVNNLKTNNGIFASLLVGVILIVGALSFFPSWILGPISGSLDQSLWRGNGV